MTRTQRTIGLSSAILLLLFLSTSPSGLPSVVLVVPFVLLFIIITLGISTTLARYNIAAKKRLRIGLVVATIPILLLVLQSLGQLTVRDAFVIFALFGTAYFYVSRFGMQTVGQ